MAFQISPGINITEIDRTGVINQITSQTTAAYVGKYKWGACDQITNVFTENQLVKEFGAPDDEYYEDFFVAANFIGYGAPLQLIRAGQTAAKVATRNGNGFLANQIWNDDLYDTLTDYGTTAASGVTGVFCAKYPGYYGNSLKVSLSDNPNRTIGGLPTLNPEWTGQRAYLESIILGPTGSVAVGDYLKFGDRRYQYEVVGFSGSGTTSGCIIEVSGSTTAANTIITGVGATISAVWAYERYLSYKPSTSLAAAALGYSNDEVAIAVIDEDGLFSGQPGQVLETFIGSKASNATLKDGSLFYYPRVVSGSDYVRWISHPYFGGPSGPSAEFDATGSELGGTTAQKAWGSAFNNLGATFDGFTGGNQSFRQFLRNQYFSLNGGIYSTPSAAEILEGYKIFEDSQATESDLLLQGTHDVSVAQYLIDLAEARKDAIVFVSPDKDDVVGVNPSEAVEAIIDWKNLTLARNSSYAVMDSGWKYQYDKYNDTYRWMPLNPDIAGLAASTDNTARPWFSPAGYTRGQIRNVVKLALNPSKALRDVLYTENINPVVTQAGSGTVLLGDKTLFNKPSAFDRINVRRLFIALEKAASTAAKFQLFEFNDEFTRANFVGIMEPFLREVQASRGIVDFKIICDETNNTTEVVENNQFVADIYIKPQRTINYVQLNFIATRTNANFEEIGAAVNVL